MSVARTIAALLAALALSGCSTVASGPDGYGYPDGDGLNSQYEDAPAKFDEAKFTNQPHNAPINGFTTRPFYLSESQPTQKFTFLPAESPSVGSVLVVATLKDESDVALDNPDLSGAPEESTLILYPEKGEGYYQLRVSYENDNGQPASDWTVDIQEVEEISRTTAKITKDTFTKTDKDDGVRSNNDSSTQTLDPEKFSTTPIQVRKEFGFTSYAFDLGNELGNLATLSFIPVDDPSAGTLLVNVTEDSDDIEPLDFAPEDVQVGLGVTSPGQYQVEVNYQDGNEWEITLQRVSTLDG